jgi:hypothetical protein
VAQRQDKFKCKPSFQEKKAKDEEIKDFSLIQAIKQKNCK